MRALSIKEQVLGPEHPQVVVVLYRLAQVYQEQEKYEEAERLFQRTIAIDERIHGPDDIEVAIDLEAYASLLLQMSKDEQAVQVQQRAEQIRMLASGVPENEGDAP